MNKFLPSPGHLFLNKHQVKEPLSLLNIKTTGASSHDGVTGTKIALPPNKTGIKLNKNKCFQEMVNRQCKTVIYEGIETHNVSIAQFSA